MADLARLAIVDLQREFNEAQAVLNAANSKFRLSQDSRHKKLWQDVCDAQVVSDAAYIAVSEAMSAWTKENGQ